jgi:hypothetical protein
MARKISRGPNVAQQPHLAPDQAALQLKRLREARDQIADFQRPGFNVFSPAFETWRRRVRGALEAVFGPDHRYVIKFLGLHFSVPRMRFAGAPEWDRDDQEAWVDDWSKVPAFLGDVIEELETAAPPAPVPAMPAPTRPPALTIVVNNNNILQSTTAVSVTQVLDIVNSLQLSETQREEVRDLVKEFDDGAKANKPMSVLGKCIDGIKAYGPTVFKDVAAPLLLGWMKQHAGIP